MRPWWSRRRRPKPVPTESRNSRRRRLRRKVRLPARPHRRGLPLPRHRRRILRHLQPRRRPTPRRRPLRLRPRIRHRRQPRRRLHTPRRRLLPPPRRHVRRLHLHLRRRRGWRRGLPSGWKRAPLRGLKRALRRPARGNRPPVRDLRLLNIRRVGRVRRPMPPLRMQHRELRHPRAREQRLPRVSGRALHPTVRLRTLQLRMPLRRRRAPEHKPRCRPVAECATRPRR
jgi:hypothetical protein